MGCRLVQRRHRQLRDRTRARRLRSAAERPHHRERAGRREERENGLLEHAGSAEAGLGAKLRARARVPRSALAIQRPGV